MRDTIGRQMTVPNVAPANAVVESLPPAMTCIAIAASLPTTITTVSDSHTATVKAEARLAALRAVVQEQRTGICALMVSGSSLAERELRRLHALIEDNG